MLKPYQPNLREILQATNRNEGVVLNAQFADWEEHLAESLRDREKQHHLYTYTSPEDERLFELAQEHVKKYSQKSESDNAVVIIHPFYLPLTDRSTLAGVEEFQTEGDTYLERLVGFLHWQKENADTRVVLFETLHHYAAASSLLLERGLVDDVFFTTFDSGKLLQEDQNERFRDKTVYVGGGYNFACLSDALCKLVPLPLKKKYALSDLSIEYPPRMRTSIHPNKIYIRENMTFPQDHCLTTEEVKKRLRKKS